MKESPNKTNVMRTLDKAGIRYTPMTYAVDEDNLAGTHIAEEIGLPPEIVFKTLVARGDKKGLAVFCIPAPAELNLKEAARLTGNKKLEMVPVKELLGLTGYIRGACSPIGMKKKFPTFIDETCILYDQITISAGIRGIQLLLDPNDLIAVVEAQCAALTV
ncbi:MAG: Cys-tRNA(Pro) deacylase [Ruminococcaceae bacterium]|nr:Cys-tRNA(Pro) deacylase [Oscillospiraceae bacterium]